MRHIAFILALLTLQCSAQDHVRWASTSRKLSTSDYEVHLVASIDSLHHIYALNTSIYSIRTRVEPQKGPAPFKVIGALRDTAYAKLTRYDSMWREPMTVYLGSVDLIQVVHFTQWVPKEVVFLVFYTECTDSEVGIVRREKLVVHFL